MIFLEEDWRSTLQQNEVGVKIFDRLRMKEDPAKLENVVIYNKMIIEPRCIINDGAMILQKLTAEKEESAT
jgi:UDP-3-O-[3-hydroxymyristoyl] glucosamine N-acyltransferase